jgi:peptidoglycan/xylan/chitin deacetylase (PgdA/CDA1 family)
MEPRATGPYPYSPIVDRPRLTWPNNAKVALWVIPNIEFYALNQRIGPNFADPPDVPAFAVRDYGARVGIWRIMDVMSRFGVRGTVALNSDVCDQYPQIIEKCVELDWELMGHNYANTRRLSVMEPDEERATVLGTIDRIEKASGRRPAGWMGAGGQESWNSLDFFVEAGLKYVGEWVADDQPFLMDPIKGRQLVALPYTMEINDIPIFEHKHYTPQEFEGMVKRQFDVLYREGAESGRVMAIALHPYLIGLPHRIDSLTAVLEYITAHEDVWLATGEEITDHYLSQLGGS